MSIDVRTILFSKIKKGNIAEYSDFFDSDSNNYICIGNYDAVKIYKTSEYANIFKVENPTTADNHLTNFKNEKKAITSLYLDTKNASVFYHPLHIVTHKDQNTETFWSKKTNCFSMMLIYGTRGNSTISDLENDLEEKLIKGDSALELGDFLIYRSVNLSELVIIVKHDNLSLILKNIEKIGYFYPTLQTHTVSGFMYDYASRKICEYKEDDKIDLVKITGTIRSNTQAKVLFDFFKTKFEGVGTDSTINPHNFLAFGNNDFNVIYKEVSTSKIIEVINCCINQKKDLSLDDNNPTNYLPIQEAFFTIKTRLHTNYKAEDTIEEQDKSTDSGHNSIKIENIKKIIEQAKNEVKKYIDVKDYNNQLNTCSNWGYPFIETLNMLSDMINNPSLSRVCYFTIDSIIVFFKTITEIDNNQNSMLKILKENENTLNRFASGFNTLVEQIVRVDGYFSQEPGYSPLVYNMVPAGILEYFCSYLYTVTDIINEISDSTKLGPSCLEKSEYSYATLPLPILENDISFEAILPRAGQKGRYSQVNILEIPHEKLYDSQTMLFSITHEVTHFCGEKIRCRHQRYDCFIEFIANYLSYEFDLESLEDTVIPFITNYFNQMIPETNRYYFNNLMGTIQKAVYTFYSDIDLKNKIYNILTDSSNHKNCTEYYRYYEFINAMSMRQTLFHLLGSPINAITYLFKECFADLTTVKLLDIKLCDYCDIINDMDQAKKGKSNFSETSVVEALLELRKALVCYAINPRAGIDSKLIPNKNQYKFVRSLCRIICYKKNNCNKQLNDEIQKIMEQFNAERNPTEAYDFPSLFFTPSCIVSVANYLISCSIELNNCINNNSQDILDLRSAYNVGIDPNRIFSDDYCDFIYKTRKKINEKAIDSLTLMQQLLQ